MKKRSFIFYTAILLAFFIFSSGCTSISEEGSPSSESGVSSAGEDSMMQASLSVLQGDSYKGLEALFLAAGDCAKSAQTSDLENSDLKKKMSEIVSENDFVLTVLYIGKDNIIKAGSPEIEGISAGDSLESDETVVLMNKDKVPTLTSLFELKQGGYGAAIYYPVFLNESYDGFISIAFKPGVFFGKYARIIEENYGYEVMVLQTDGVILYDPDETETGKATFNNSAYEDFPEITEAAEKVVSEWSGSCEYSYYATGTDKEVKKSAFWTTLANGGNEWRLMVIKNTGDEQ